MTSRLLLSLILAAIPHGALVGARAAGQEAEDRGGPQGFIRIYVQADRLQEFFQTQGLSREKVRYLPVDPEQFERLIEAARTASRTDRALAGAAITSALYEGRLEGDTLVGSEASLEVVQTADGPGMLPLDPCGLAIGEARFSGNDQQPAPLGAGADGRLLALVERSGRLQFDWSLRGVPDLGGGVRFPWEVPACPSTRLVLDLPQGMTPVADQGVVIEEGLTGEGLRRWRIELGGHYRVGIRLVPAEIADGRLPSVQVRQATTYEFSPRGATVTAELRIDAPEEPLRRITLLLDAGLRLTTAEYVRAREGGSPLPWTVASPPAGSGGSRATLEFPEPLQGTGRLVRLQAIVPLTTDGLWRLPGIRPEGMFWQEGGATLSVLAPLVVKELVPIHARQLTKISSLASPQSGDTLQLQYFAPEATAEVVLTLPEPRLQVDCGTTVEFGVGEATGLTIAQLDMASGEQFQIEADVAKDWVIESVELEPPELLADWFSDKEPIPKLTVRLTTPLRKLLTETSSPPARLRVTSRLPSSMGRTFAVEELTPLRFPVATEARHLTWLRARQPCALKLTGAEALNRLDPNGLDGAALALFADQPRDPLFLNDADAAGMQVSVETGKPDYSATIEVKATVSDEGLEESYRLRCVPESSRVDRVLVRFSHARTAPLQWSLGTEDEDQWSARRLPQAEQTAGGLGPDGEAWEIRLARPRSVPFEIRGTRSAKLTAPEAVNLISLPKATAQQATVVVCSAGPAGFQIQNRLLEPIPIETVPWRQCNPARARYRYDPVRDLAPQLGPALTVAPVSARVPPAARVWSFQLESCFEASGIGRHLAVYRLENDGVERLRLSLPSSVSLRDVGGAWVDGARVALQPIEDGGGRVLNIDLESDRRFPVVSVQYSTVGRPLGLIRSLVAPMPEVDLPVVARHWTVWLPPGYEVLDSDLRWQPWPVSARRWSERLLGAVGCRPDRSPFDPLVAEDWRRMVRREPTRPLAEQKADDLQERLAALRSQYRSASQAEGRDWGTLLTDATIQDLLADVSNGQVRLQFLVDRPALARLGLTPRTAVEARAGTLSDSDGVELLRQAGLTLLVHPKAVVLTSATGAALHHAQLLPVDHGQQTPQESQVLRWVRPGPLRGRIDRAAAGQPDGHFVPLHLWRAQPAEPNAPWVLSKPAGLEPVDTRGWTASRLEIPAEASAELSVVRRDSLRVLRWAAFLGVIGLAWWKLIHRPATLTALLGLLGAAVFLLPEAHARIASGALVGTLFALGLGLIRPIPKRPTPIGRPGAESAGSRRVGGVLPIVILAIGVAALLILGASAMGQEPKAGPSLPWSPYHGVLIPVDQDQQPTGGKYQVPEDFYRQLQRLAGEEEQKPQGWLVGGATYRGTLSRPTAADRLVVSQMTATFDFLVLGPSAQIRIPFGNQGPALLPDGALLDGRVIQPEVRQGALVLSIPEPGGHRLDLSLKPDLQTDGTSSGFDLSIPPLATSRLDLELPPDAPQIEVRSAAGRVRRHADTETPRLEAQLGSTDRLSVRWEEGPGLAGSGPVLDVEELLWLKVRPRSVELDAHFNFNVVEGRVGEFHLVADPRLQPSRPFEVSPFRTADVQTTPGQPQTIRLELETPVSDRVVVKAAFRLKDASGVGNLRLPYLATRGARPTRRWMAVWVDPKLTADQQAPERLQSVAPPLFTAAWGQTDLEPQSIYDLAAGESLWSMAVRPREPRITAGQTLALSFAPKEAQLRFDARLRSSAGYKFQYRLSAPKDLQVESVLLVEDGEERADRWSQAPDGTVTVFLKGPVGGEQESSHELSLRGRLPTPASGKLELPMLRIEGAEQRSSVVRLFRKPGVRLDVDQVEGLTEITAPVIGPSESASGRLVKCFAADGAESARVALTLSPNRPKAQAEQITSLSWDGEAWEARVEFRMEVEGGVIDELRLKCPLQWGASIKCDPPAQVEVVDLADEARRLIVRPRLPITGQQRLTISGPLAAALGHRVRVPQVSPEEVDLHKHLLILPTQLDLRPVTWETEGLSETSMPEDFHTPPVARESFVAYQVDDSRFRAVLQRHRGGAQVRLVDVRLAWQADGTCHGLASFDFEPTDLSKCSLRMPSGCQLIQVTVAGSPQTPVPAGQRLWHVRLGPNRLPQRVEVLFAGQVTPLGESGRVRLDVPALVGLPVRQTLWTVSGPSTYELGLPEGLRSLGRLEHALVRLENVEALLVMAADTAWEESEDVDPWCEAWLHLWGDCDAEVQRAGVLAGQADASRAADGRATRLKSLPSPVADWLRSTNVLARVSVEVPAAATPGELWPRSLDRTQPATLCLGRGGSASVTLRYRRVETDSLLHRLIAAGATAGMALLAIVGIRRRVLSALLCRWPHLLGVVAGLVWWLWLWPSILGWGIVLVSLLASFRWGWRRLGQPGSTIVPISPPER